MNAKQFNSGQILYSLTNLDKKIIDQTYDVSIIGAGVVGSALAYNLS